MLLHDDSHADRSGEPVADALERLDPAARALLGLSARRGMSVDEIAEVTDNHPDDVAAWLRDGIREVAIDAGVEGDQPLTRTFHRLRQLDDEAWSPDETPSEPLADSAAADAPGRRLRPTAVYTALLAAIALIVPLNDVWPAQIVSLGLLVTVPGSLLLRAIGIPGRSIAAFPLYVPAASLAVLFAAGLTVDLAGPQLGVERPLHTVPMLVAIEAFCVVLLVAGAFRSPAEVAVPWRSLGLRVWNLWPLVLPLVSAAGAARLTAGHGNVLATAGLALVAVTVLACTALAGHLSKTQLALVLYGVGLAAVWS